MSDILGPDPWVVEPEHLTLPWSGKRDGSRFLCGLCMRRFAVGDMVRFIFCPNGANTFVCVRCDGHDVEERWADRWHYVILPILSRWGGE